MHGQCIRSIDRELTSEVTLLWLSRGDLKKETESEVIVSQDWNYKPNIMRQNITNRNR
jgi:hypothetical protein